VQANREQVITRVETARNQLKLVMGLPLDRDISVAAAREDIEALRESNLADSETRALAGRKDLAAARTQRQAARARVARARPTNPASI
jgi:outer membrane protein TolC